MWLKIAIAIGAIFLVGIPLLAFLSARVAKDIALAGLALLGMCLLLLPVAIVIGAIAVIGILGPKHG